MMTGNTCKNWSEAMTSVSETIRSEFKQRIQGEVLFAEPMSRHTTVQVGGAADIWIEPKDEHDCVAAQELAQMHGLPFMTVGRGSNLVVRDGGIRGVVLHVGDAFQGVTVHNQEGSTYTIDVGAGMLMKQLLSWAADQALSGIEGLEGVPGTVGGAVTMNAGTPHGSIGDAVVSVTWLEKGKLVTRTADKLEFGYRKAKIPRAATVLSVRLTLEKGDGAAVIAKLQELRKYRQSKQPLQLPSMGSVFKNPDKSNSAGSLIEEAGLKGVRVGKAQISPQHANWIVNLGGATAKDVEVLIRLAKDTVKEKTGYILEPEVKIIGEY
jgi:UDP-N-acetylmuramate dehydrogenase